VFRREWEKRARVRGGKKKGGGERKIERGGGKTNEREQVGFSELGSGAGSENLKLKMYLVKPLNGPLLCYNVVWYLTPHWGDGAPYVATLFFYTVGVRHRYARTRTSV